MYEITCCLILCTSIKESQHFPDLKTHLTKLLASDVDSKHQMYMKVIYC